jgi:hypothetical protein
MRINMSPTARPASVTFREREDFSLHAFISIAGVESGLGRATPSQPLSHRIHVLIMAIDKANGKYVYTRRLGRVRSATIVMRIRPIATISITRTITVITPGHNHGPGDDHRPGHDDGRRGDDDRGRA